MRNTVRYLGWLLCVALLCTPVSAQYYQNNYNQGQDPYGADPYGAAQRGWGQNNQQQYSRQTPGDDLQYDRRDAEMILRDQVHRVRRQPQPVQANNRQQQMYDNYYGHRIQDEDQVNDVMTVARSIGGMIKPRTSKSFIVIDKRNFQFYLYDGRGELLRIGPVAIGKGKTQVGAFETPTGVFPIKSKVPVADWVRPDWYFIEEGEPIPKNWEERRVPGFFRYKLVFDGSRYIHYAEATGGRLTHGCLGLDWQDAEAVFHTLQVGSYCIIVDPALLSRIARGDFPVKKAVAVKPVKPVDGTTTVAANSEEDRRSVAAGATSNGQQAKAFGSLW
jgi:hypothetical protein